MTCSRVVHRASKGTTLGRASLLPPVARDQAYHTCERRACLLRGGLVALGHNSQPSKTMPNTSTQIERRFVPTQRARIHVAIAGQGEPLLLLHQTPRSQDEFRDALPLLGKRYRAIAMDTVGFGESDALPAGDDSIESWASCAFDLLDELGIASAAIAGHHTGAATAIEMAAARPERIRA